jgi:hypothetical protein
MLYFQRAVQATGPSKVSLKLTKQRYVCKGLTLHMILVHRSTKGKIGDLEHQITAKTCWSLIDKMKRLGAAQMMMR